MAILTRNTGMLGPIVNLLGYIMNAIFEFFNLMGIQNIALSIIFFTLITKVLMLPLSIKQQKFTRLQSVMNPELQAIAAKYKGKKDEVSMRRQNAETQEVYKKYGASQMAGCLPLLISLPIMFALISVINNIPAHVNYLREFYENIANAVKNSSGYVETLMEMAKTVGTKTKNFSEVSEGYLTNNHIIDILSRFKAKNWDVLSESIPAIQSVINLNLPEIERVNKVFGIFNIAESPGLKFPGIFIPVISVALNYVQTKQMTAKSSSSPKGEDPTMATMNSMSSVMPLMSGFFAVMLPIGVGIYWIASSFFTIIQQFFIDKYLDKVDLNEMVEKNVTKQKKRNEKLLNSPNEKIKEMAQQYTKTIEYNENDDSNKLNSKSKENNTNSDVDTSTASISEIANILKRNSEKGDKK